MVAIIGIFVSAADLVGALTKQFCYLMSNMALSPGIADCSYKSVCQTGLAIDFAHIQNTAVGADARLIEPSSNSLSFQGCKFKLWGGSIIHA